MLRETDLAGERISRLHKGSLLLTRGSRCGTNERVSFAVIRFVWLRFMTRPKESEPTHFRAGIVV